MLPSGKIHVDYLCGQPSRNFSGKGDNMFCKVCRHGIHDLKHRREEEVAHLIRQQKGSICGSFYQDQFITDERTRRAPARFRILVAGMVAWLSAAKVNAQVIPVPVPTEQHYQGSDSIPVKVEVPPAITHQPSCPPSVEPISTKKRMYYRIGTSSWFVTRRFPFIVRRRMRRGRISITPSF